MFGGSKRKLKCPIGLDIGAQHVRLLQLEQRKDSWRIRGAAIATMPPDAVTDVGRREQFLADTLPGMLSSADFVGRHVVTSLPALSVIYKNLRVPRMPADELRAAVEWEAADRLRIDPADLRLQYFDAGEVRQGEDLREEIILLAVPRSEIEAHVDTLVRCHLKPAAIEVIPSALARALDSDVAGNRRSTGLVVVDIGHASTKVMITRQGRVVFFKLIEIGGKTIDHTVAEHLNLPTSEVAAIRRQLVQHHHSDAKPSVEHLFGNNHHEDIQQAVTEAMRSIVGELAREIGLCLRYYSVTFRGQRPDAIQLAGGEAHDPQLVHILAEAAGVVTEAARPLHMVDPVSIPQTPDFQGNLCDWTVAAGLSMRDPRIARQRGAA